ncbi:hypothetical protein D9615_002038 [Tricholomella constricta]|uniref:RING-type domain-containing protein n=1 Tax=Tricholomella constricta TaxID=117010 RepID=A0A8H5HNB7_9AGAR|nr:hypothetical protein D9615_002038 [Tricholomella constricta]
MSNPQILCYICQDAFTIDFFRFLTDCGHGFCEKCLERTSQQRNCPVCRHPKADQEPHRIFLTFAESTAGKKPLTVAEGLDMISAETPAISLRRAGRKIREEAKVAADGRASRDLLDAARRLEDRLYPLLSDLESERAKNASLLEETESLKAKLAETVSTQAQVLHLENKLNEMEENYKVAVALAEEAKNHVVHERDERLRLNQTKHVLKVKLSALAKQAKQARFTHDADDSLQVEQPVEGMGETDTGQPLKKRRIVKKIIGG